MRNLLVFGVAIVWIGATASVRADESPRSDAEWTRFRGPNGTGISAARGIPSRWTEPDFRWRVAIPGRSDGQPVFWGDQIFLTSAQEEGKERLVLCLRKEDGRELWCKKFALSSQKPGKFGGPGNAPCHAQSTPVVDRNCLVACFADPQHFLVKAWDHSGNELWTVDLGPYEAVHGFGASPIIFEDKVIVPNDQDGPSFVIALDIKTGKTVWKTERRPGPPAGNGGSTAYATPCVVQHNGSAPELLLASRSHGISCLDARTGAAKWEAVVFNIRCVASPVVAGDLAIATCGQGGGAGNFLSAVKMGGHGDVTSTHEAYRIKTSTPYVPTPLVVGDKLHLVSDVGVASCVEAATGKVLWTERLEKSNFYSSPILVDGKIYCGSREGVCFVWEPSSDQFKLVARNPLGEGTHTPAAIDGSRIYFKTFTHLVCIGK